LFSNHEIIDLALGLVAASIIIFVFRKWKVQKPRYFYIAFFFILSGHVFTIVEGVVWKDFFNLLEHSSVLFAGVFFYIGCRKYLRTSVRTGDD
jgi:hypothetical protein